MMPLVASEPLTSEGFAPFGAVFAAPAPKQRIYLDGSFANLRPAAQASLSIAFVAPQTARPAPLTVIERHRFSSQSFTPLDAGRFLAVVAPGAADGSADLSRLRVFVASDFQSFTYGADVWHGPITALDGPMRFAIMMFNDGSSGDEEVIRFSAPYAEAQV
jgi:ureidoglycolate lyase